MLAESSSSPLDVESVPWLESELEPDGVEIEPPACVGFVPTGSESAGAESEVPELALLLEVSVGAEALGVEAAGALASPPEVAPDVSDAPEDASAPPVAAGSLGKTGALDEASVPESVDTGAGLAAPVSVSPEVGEAGAVVVSVGALAAGSDGAEGSDAVALSPEPSTGVEALLCEGSVLVTPAEPSVGVAGSTGAEASLVLPSVPVAPLSVAPELSPVEAEPSVGAAEGSVGAATGEATGTGSAGVGTEAVGSDAAGAAGSLVVEPSVEAVVSLVELPSLGAVVGFADAPASVLDVSDAPESAGGLESVDELLEASLEPSPAAGAKGSEDVVAAAEPSAVAGAPRSAPPAIGALVGSALTSPALESEEELEGVDDEVGVEDEPELAASAEPSVAASVASSEPVSSVVFGSVSVAVESGESLTARAFLFGIMAPL